MADHKTADIRKFIIDTFSDEELTTFCFDYFRDVYEDFATGMSKTTKAQRLIERCVRRETLPGLLTALRKERPEQYEAKLGKPVADTLTQAVVRQRDPRLVFISHAHEDAQFAHRLAADLEAQGWRAWIAPDSIRPGEKWANAINRGLEECGAFVVVLTPTAVVSRWVVDETNIAIDLEHKRLLKFIPVQVESCKQPLLWTAYQYISFRDSYDTGFAALLVELGTYLEVTEGYQPIPNPYQAGRPLPTGSPLFFGREDVFAFIAEYAGGPSLNDVLVLIGQRRIGKTSLLKQLPVRLEKRFIPVYINAQAFDVEPGMAGMFYLLSRRISSSLSTAGVEIAAPTREDFEPSPSQVFEQEFLASVEEALGDRRLLLAFDEFEEIEARVREGKVDRAILPFLRHLMQHSAKVAFLFVGTHKLDELTKDYWSVFFNIAHCKEIRFLDEKAASRLIREPVAAHGLMYDDLAVKRVLDITAGHPYFVQLLCLALVDYANASERNYITVEDVRSVVDQTIAPGEAHFRWLWEQSGPKEQLVLATLTELLCDETMVMSTAVSGELARKNVLLDPAEMSEILSRLVAQDLLEEVPDHVLQYRFKLEIVNLWIRRNRPLSQVIEDITVRAPYRIAQAPVAEVPK